MVYGVSVSLLCFGDFGALNTC